MTSALMPCSDRMSAARFASYAISEAPTIVTSEPSRTIRAFPNGIEYSSSGTSSSCS
jgi:hypothetical protein